MDQTLKEGKPTAIFAYLTIFGTLIAHFMNLESKNTFAAFHIRQALGIHIIFHLFAVIVPLFDIWVFISFWISIGTVWAYGMVAAIQGEKREVPLVGKYFQKWFKRKG